MMRYLLTVYIFALVLTAIFISLVTFDREAVLRPGVVSAVPISFRAEANAVVVQRKLESDDLASTALPDAVRLVRREPVQAESLVLLARSAYAAGQDELALRAIYVAGTRGWREPIAQLSIAEMALTTSQSGIAAQRLAAVWAVGRGSDQLHSATKRALKSAVGREVFAEQFAENGSWTNSFITWAAVSAEPSDFVDTVALARVRGANIDCPVLVGPTRQLVARGAVRDANALWTTACNSIGQELNDLQFVESSSESIEGPFDWIIARSAGLDGYVEGTGLEAELKYEMMSGRQAMLASKLLSLPPGTYALSLGYAGSPPIASVQCQGSLGERRPLRSLKADRNLTFTISPSNCASQKLTLSVNRGIGSIRGLRISRIAS